MGSAHQSTGGAVGSGGTGVAVGSGRSAGGVAGPGVTGAGVAAGASGAGGEGVSVATGTAGPAAGADPPPVNAGGMNGRGKARTWASVNRICVAAGETEGAAASGPGVLPECATSGVDSSVGVAVGVAGRAALPPLLV